MGFEKLSPRLNQVTPFHVMRLMALAKSLERQGHHVVHMEVGEPDFETPQPVVKAAQSFLAHGRVHYTAAQGLPELREKISDFYASRYQLRVDPDRIFITPGASGALLVAIAALIDAGDELLLTDPGYPCNANMVRLFGGIPKLVPVFAQSAFQFTAELLEQYWTQQTRGILMASPSNPTGTMIPSAQWVDLVATLQHKKGCLISDEIYHGLEYGPPAQSALNLCPDAVVINSFSKYFGMTGWRLGWLVVPDGMQSAIERLIQNCYIAAPTHSQHAALAAFEPETVAILEQRRDTFRQRRDLLLAGLTDLGFEVAVEPQGAFYIYADCSRFSDDSEALALDILDRVQVAITPGLDFGNNQAQRYLRFAYTTSSDELELGLERLRRYLRMAA